MFWECAEKNQSKEFSKLKNLHKKTPQQTMTDTKDFN